MPLQGVQGLAKETRGDGAVARSGPRFGRPGDR